jgi:hypothetical protein
LLSLRRIPQAHFYIESRQSQIESQVESQNAQFSPPYSQGTHDSFEIRGPARCDCFVDWDSSRLKAGKGGSPFDQILIIGDSDRWWVFCLWAIRTEHSLPIFKGVADKHNGLTGYAIVNQPISQSIHVETLRLSTYRSALF